MRYLIDMDGVIANFEQRFLDIWRKENPNLDYISLENRRTFYQNDEYPKEYEGKIQEIIGREGFFRSLNPILGGLESIRELRELGNEVYICTSPLTKSESCASEKYQWIKEHLGEDWMKTMLVTSDKTVVHGDYLVDDRPKIEGIQEPSWEHILYDQPYNQDIDKRRINWDNWKERLL